MKRLMTATLLLASAAWAGERYLGTIYAADGGSINNATTGYGYAASNGAAAFTVPTPALLSVWCSAASAVAVNVATVDAGTGVPVAASQFFTTSTTKAITVSAADGGTYTGGVVAAINTPGVAATQCRVFERKGNE